MASQGNILISIPPAVALLIVHNTGRPCRLSVHGAEEMIRWFQMDLRLLILSPQLESTPNDSRLPGLAAFGFAVDLSATPASTSLPGETMSEQGASDVFAEFRKSWRAGTMCIYWHSPIEAV